MSKPEFDRRLKLLLAEQEAVLARKNEPDERSGNGVFERFRYPVLTAAHTPLFWRYDLDRNTNPRLLERLGINAVFNPGAIEIDGVVYLVCRVEGSDRKSFFAVAESKSGTSRFRFWDRPVDLPETGDPDINVYDMRLVRHQDGYIYGLFCTERRDPAAPPGDTSSAVAQAGIVRTRDLVSWQRLPDLQTSSAQQRNVVLHPELVSGKYAFYTRPQDSFIEAGKGGGIGWGLSDAIDPAIVRDEIIVDPKAYHTIKETKNGQGPAPLKTPRGWLHIAHGVRNTAAGLRYVLYAFLTDLNEPWRVTRRPGGYLIAPRGDERVGDVGNVVFCNGAVLRPNGEVLIYYASSDTRIHVAKSDAERLLDYVENTPEDGLRTRVSLEQRRALIERNLELLRTGKWPKI